MNTAPVAGSRPMSSTSTTRGCRVREAARASARKRSIVAGAGVDTASLAPSRPVRSTFTATRRSVQVWTPS
jgi:hypothetical protein